MNNEDREHEEINTERAETTSVPENPDAASESLGETIDATLESFAAEILDPNARAAELGLEGPEVKEAVSGYETISGKIRNVAHTIGIAMKTAMAVGVAASSPALNEADNAIDNLEQDVAQYQKAEIGVPQKEQTLTALDGRPENEPGEALSPDKEHTVEAVAASHTSEASVIQSTEEEKLAASPEDHELLIAGDIAAQSLEQFNITKEELGNVSGFSELSHGQQRMVLLQLRRVTNTEIHDEAREEVHDRYREERGSNSGFFRRAATIMKEQFGGKKVAVVKKEKELAQKVSLGGLSTHGAILQELVTGMITSGSEIQERPDGSLRMEFINTEGFPPEEAAKLEQLNEKAHALADCSYKFETATFLQKITEKRRKRNYEEAKRDAINILSEKMGGETAFAKTAEIETKITMGRFLASANNEDDMKKIKGKHVWPQAIGTASGRVMGAFILEDLETTALASLAITGAFVPPIATSLRAGVRGYLRARETFEDQDEAMRRGKDIALLPGTEKNMIDADGEQGAAAKLDYLVDKVINYDWTVDNIRNQGELLDALKQRIDYTKRKIEEGKVIFGTKDAEVKNQYNLVAALLRAEAMMNTERATDEHGENLRNRLDGALKRKDKNTSKKRNKETVKQVVKTVVLGEGGQLLVETAANAYHYVSKKALDVIEKAANKIENEHLNLA